MLCGTKESTVGHFIFLIKICVCSTICHIIGLNKIYSLKLDPSSQKMFSHVFKF